MKWEYLILHHTGAEEKDAEQVKRYHLSLGWRDTGYHFIIERDGRIVQGRSLALYGAHCLANHMNNRGIGIALIGNLENHPPHPEQFKSLLEFCRRLTRQHLIPPEKVLGHREVPGAHTLCPGRYFPVEEVRTALSETPGEIQPAAGTFWRVQVGAFTDRQRAQNCVQNLQSLGIKAFVVPPVL